MKASEFSVAKEGLPFILFCGFASLIVSILGYEILGLTSLLGTGLVLWFFRDPCRIVPEADDAVISPADGKIIRVEEIFDDRFLQKNVIKISIFMNVFNVHVNRIPYPGSVQRVLLQPGKFYSADKDKAVLHNEHCAVLVETASGQRYAVVQIAGLIARRIVCRAEPGDQVQAGQRYGLIRFGSRVDVYLPKSSESLIRSGQKVRAGETILAKMR
jgi:phosphatidylserine decarboxylase